MQTPPRISDEEAKLYYPGLPSRPILVARTGSTWEAPTGPEAYPRLKELRVVGNHEINEVWEDDLALKVHAILREEKMDWSSTDVLRIAGGGAADSSDLTYVCHAHQLHPEDHP
ncbi:uncharacterized protein B0H18DRAFT_1041564 [Fomitopsis serialis]|uniref:uncharacterized protein n=1 Tax=Fomitopsis serialis TaxID=139415 RepID=UPI0020089D92|nr:uncharacterized protein B0H18DRAFT_1041564 [Neoantrodia serialis]KAH9915507.1 hypothetical protein B0H18DRAFT_1041564 [Neoantrodia serialis]